MGFNAIDLRTSEVGDIVIFRTGSLTHSQDLPARHGTYARISAFAKSSKGAPQVKVTFKDKSSMSMAPSNLVNAALPGVAEAAQAAHGMVLDIIAQCETNDRSFLIIPSIQVALGEMGMYDRLRAPLTPATAENDNDLPY